MVAESLGLQWEEQDSAAVDTARVLAADAVEKAGNGHPGTAISLAPVAYLLYQKVMRTNPADPQWLGRDRFILSPGHTSMTQYAQLFLGGYGLELEDLKALRTFGSLTPGHPEYRHTPGVEITTGPLGQGLASAVGFAFAQRRMRGLFDPEAPAGESVFDHMVWVIASDGDIQEGVTSEASSLAGHQELGNLVVIYDDNEISIEGDTKVAFSEDVLKRYEAYGWHTQRVDFTASGEYVEDLPALYAALEAARAETQRPSLISLRTIIGWPSPQKQNTGGIHGAALGGEELRGLKEALGFDPEETFVLPDGVLDHTRDLVRRGAEAQKEWEERFHQWQLQHPARHKELLRMLAHELPDGLDEALPVFSPGKDVATRAASGKVLSALGPLLPELWGGSADLAGSNNTTMEGASSFVPYEKQSETFSGGPYGRTLHFGIREHAAAAIVNGITLSSPTRAYSGTFLMFSDYQRPAIRLSALMGIGSIYVWTHDSIGLGEDGPTHQPVEQLASLRAIPGLNVIRPADANETVYAWRKVLQTLDAPSGLALSRQNLPVIDRSADHMGAAELTERGGYILAEATTGEGTSTSPELILLATGSEVQLALAAREQLQAEGTPTRVVSLPCWEWFQAQKESYREEVLPARVRARVSVEAASPMGWRDYVGDAGRIIGLDHYGASANYQRLYEEFGITVDAVVQAGRDSLAAAGASDD